MKVYPASAIHNVAVVGHNGVGKTTLVSALLHEAGATPRFGRVEEGNAPTDFDPEEVERKISIGLAVASLEWKKKKINLIDTPGYGIFVSEMICGLRAADAALLIVDAVAGVEVQTEKAWKTCDELGLPRLVVVNRMDRERADGGRVMDQLQKKFGRAVVCVEAPIGKEKGFRGVIDLVAMQGWLTDDAGKTAPGPIPDEFAADAAQLHESLVEMVAEGDDKLMETFFSQGNLSEEQMKPALRKAIQERKIAPVLFTASGSHETGVEKLLDEIEDLLPTADAFRSVATGKGGTAEALAPDPAGPTAALVFKTISDPYAGRLTLFRVYSGTVKGDGTYWNGVARDRRAVRPRLLAPWQDAPDGPRGPGRRHRRRREAQGDAHRRLAVRRRRSRSPSTASSSPSPRSRSRSSRRPRATRRRSPRPSRSSSRRTRRSTSRATPTRTSSSCRARASSTSRSPSRA